MKSRPVTLAAQTAVLVVCAASLVLAWSHDPSQNNVVCDVTDAQGCPSIVHVGEGNTYVVWEDHREGHIRTFGQWLNCNGDPMWTPGGIPVTDTSSYQLSAVALPGPDLSCYVVWQDARTGNWRLMAQRMDPGGFQLWNPDGVPVCTDGTGQYGHMAVGDGSGGLIVAWVDNRGGEYTPDIYAQRIDQSGSPQWAPAGAAVCTLSSYQNLHGIAADGVGGAFITWLDDRAGVDSLDIYIEHVTSDGYREWGGPYGVRVCGATGWQFDGGVVADGAGGAFVVWRDDRAGTDIYAQRVDAYGSLLWGTNGTAVQATGYAEFSPVVIDDGDGGIVVAWLDGRAGDCDIYAQRVDRWGAPLWSSGGAEVCTYGTYSEAPVLISDGAEGVVAVWEDYRPAPIVADVYAQRLDDEGNMLWDEDGVAVSTQMGRQEECVATSDGAGGVIAAWRLGSSENWEGDVYAQRLERNGYLGFPSPAIAAVEDYPDDQGGMAVISWDPSYLDEYPHQVVTDYAVWRRMVDPPEREDVDPTSIALEVGLPLDVVDELTASGWAYVGNVPASYWPVYGCDAPTYGDSTASGTPMTGYMVVAQTSDQWVFWESHPAVGYSVDNLAPGAPLGLAATPHQDDVALTWSASGYHDEDLERYIIHRSAVSGFEYGPATFTGTSTDTTYTDVDPGFGTWYYLVVGKDVHDNFGSPSNEASVSVTGVEEVPERFSLRGCYPNPFNPVTSVVFDVPEPGGELALEVFDVSGRLVRTLVRGAEAPGRKRVAWSGEDDTGARLPSAVYFLRMTAEDYEKTIKVTLLK